MTTKTPEKTPQFGSFGSHPPKGGGGKEPKRFPSGTNEEPKGTKRNHSSLDSDPLDLAPARNVDLLALIGADTNLRQKGNGPHGKEYAGACPFCREAKRDGFVVQPYNNPPTWFCRKCTGAANKTAIDYVARQWKLDPDHLSRPELVRIYEYLTDSRPDTTTTTGAPAPRPVKPLATPPAATWQDTAAAFIEWSQAQLWSRAGESALGYLRKERGLEDRTIRHFGLGYNPQPMSRPAEKWGSPGDNPEPLTLWQGIVIPWIAAGEIWGINIRQDHPKDPADRYRKVRGSRAGLYNADDLAGVESVLWLEGEGDTWRAWQEVNDVLAVGSFGPAGYDVPDLATFGRYITTSSYHLAIYDNDQAGQQGLAKIAKTIRRLRAVPLPDGCKDVTDYCQAGGDLYRLIEPHLPPLTEDDLARFDPLKP